MSYVAVEYCTSDYSLDLQSVRILLLTTFWWTIRSLGFQIWVHPRARKGYYCGTYHLSPWIVTIRVYYLTLLLECLVPMFSTVAVVYFSSNASSKEDLNPPSTSALCKCCASPQQNRRYSTERSFLGSRLSFTKRKLTLHVGIPVAPSNSNREIQEATCRGPNPL